LSRYGFCDVNENIQNGGKVMSDNNQTNPKAVDQDDASNTVKDPDDWTTGDEPMTGAQKSYLKTLSEEAGEEFDETLSKADASKRIDELQGKSQRVQGQNS